MPFILSHPAAVVPLIKIGLFARSGLSLSALMLGSMVPDLPRFIHFTHHLPSGKHFAHSFIGLFLFCLPVGMFGLWVFHSIFKPPLLSLLPLNQQERLATEGAHFRFGPLRRLSLVILSLLLGALTHIIWDSFTHAHGWTVQHFSLLREPIMQTSRDPILVYSFLQRASTVVGGALIIHWYVQWLKEEPAKRVRLPLQRERHLGVFMVVAALVLAGIYSYWVSPAPQLSWHQPFVRRTINIGFVLAVSELIIFSSYWHWTAWRRKLHTRVAFRSST
jgi:uncharacterized protein DUF4184